MSYVALSGRTRSVGLLGALSGLPAWNELLAPDGTVSVPGLKAGKVDLSDPKVYDAAKSAALQAIDKLDLDVSALIPVGTGIDGGTIAGAIQAAKSGDVSGVVAGLLTTGTMAGCSAVTAGTAAPACAVATAVLAPVITAVAQGVSDTVRNVFGISSSAAEDTRRRQVAQLGEFYDNVHRLLQGLEKTESAQLAQIKQAAVVAFANINSIALPTSERDELVKILRDRPGQTPDSAFDPSAPGGLSIQAVASTRAAEANLQALLRGPKGAEFQKVVQQYFGRLEAMSYKYDPKYSRDYYEWWRAMPPDLLILGSPPNLELIPLNYPTRRADGTAYPPLCRPGPAANIIDPFTRKPEAYAPSMWPNSGTYVPVIPAAMVSYIIKNPSFEKQDSKDASRAITDLNKSLVQSWSGTKENDLSSIAFAVTLTDRLRTQFDRVVCMVLARQRTFVAACQSALGKMVQGLTKQEVLRNLERARRDQQALADAAKVRAGLQAKADAAKVAEAVGQRPHGSAVPLLLAGVALAGGVWLWVSHTPTKRRR